MMPNAKRGEIWIGDLDHNTRQATHSWQDGFSAMRKGPPKTVADVDGPWKETPGSDTSLVQRCRKYWIVPVAELPNAILAMYLRQKIAVSLVAAEARRRIDQKYTDGSELRDDELVEALEYAVGVA